MIKRGLMFLIAMVMLSAIATAHSVNVTLDKTSFNVNDSIEGSIVLLINGTLDAETELEIGVGDGERSYLLKDLLENNLSKNYTESDQVMELSNPSTEKSILLDDSSKLIGLKIHHYATVTKLNMDVSSTSSSTLERTEMDFDDDSYADWRYLGVFSAWEDDYTVSEGFEEEGETTLLRLEDNWTLYCQLIDLPFTKHVEIYSYYNIAGTEGNMKAMVVGVKGSNPIDTDRAPGGICDLPEASGAWNKCDTALDYGASGNHLVCVFSETMGPTASDLYTIKTTTTAQETTTAYSCEYSMGEVVNCYRTGLEYDNFWIKAKAAEYDEVLDSEVDFSEWYSYTLGPIWATNIYIESSDPMYGGISGGCDSTICSVPINISSRGHGTLSLSNLELEYRTSSGDVRVRDQFYDLLEIPSVITHINGANLSEQGVDITIPLSMFGLKVPMPEMRNFTRAQGSVSVRLNSESAFARYDVFSGEAPAEGAAATIEDAEAALDSIPLDGDTGLMLELSGLNDVISSGRDTLSALSSRLESEGETEGLLAEIGEAIALLPRAITVEGSLTDIQLIEPDDITEDIAPEEEMEKVYFLQDSVQVKATINSYSIEYFSGDIERKRLVKKEVKALEPLSKINIFEVIEKRVVDSVEQVTFSETPQQVVKEDPVVKYFQKSMSTGSTKEIVYLIDTDLDVPVESVKTIIVEAEEGEEEPVIETGECGDGVCTVPVEDEESCPEDCKKKSKWPIIVLGIVIVVAGTLYIIVYRGKYSLRALTRGKSPFKKKEDLNAVIKNIQSERVKNVPDPTIRKALIAKGWTEKHVKFAFDEVEWKKKAKADTGPMEMYIAAAKSKKISDEDIVKRLVSQGWDEKLVRKGLTKKLK